MGVGNIKPIYWLCRPLSLFQSVRLEPSFLVGAHICVHRLLTHYQASNPILLWVLWAPILVWCFEFDLWQLRPWINICCPVFLTTVNSNFSRKREVNSLCSRILQSLFVYSFFDRCRLHWRKPLWARVHINVWSLKYIV